MIITPNTPLTIASGQSSSNALDRQTLDALENITIYAPSALAGVTNIEVSPKDPSDSVAGDWKKLESGGALIALTAGQATMALEVGWGGFRIVTGTPPGADEVYDWTAQEKYGAS